MQQSKQSSAFQVRGGSVIAGVDPTLVLLETDGQLDLLRVDQLGDNWYGLGSDGVTRALHGPPRQHPRQRKPAALRRTRPKIRARRLALSLYGQLG